MATLYLIRHGQASFGMENYDQLSEVGRRQCSYLPTHFRRSGKPGLNKLFAGSMERHRQSIAHSFPEAKTIELLSGLNEFDHEDILQVYQPALFEGPSSLPISKTDVKKFFRTTFPAAIAQWVGSEKGTGFKESFPDFKKRCIEALELMMKQARQEKEKELIAFTSGGFISLILMHLLQMPESKLAEVNLTIANASVSGFLFNDASISLSYFNNFSHLPEKLITYR